MAPKTRPKVEDFDAFWSEAKPKEAKPLQIKVRGEKIDIRPGIPASVVLRIERRMREDGKDSEITPQELWGMASELFGEARVEAWSKEGMDHDELQALSLFAFTAIMDRLRPGGNRASRRKKTAAKPKRKSRSAS